MSTFLTFFSQLLGLEDACRSWLGSKENSPKDPDVGCCAVCLSRIKEGDGTRKLPCRHLFHRECVDRWLDLRRRTCPLCRLSVDAKLFSFGESDGDDELVIRFSAFLVPGY